VAKRNNPEYQLHKSICKFISVQYPKAIFFSDGSGNNLSKTQAGMSKMLRSSRAVPDLFICEPKGDYHGLFLEIKTSSPFKKNGEIRGNEHLKEQLNMLWRLEQKGYKAQFVWDLTDAIVVIKKYMSS
jgi:hypothetical protein